MANNTVLNNGTGGDIVSDDQITTLNGGAIATGEKVQRMKLAYGAPASATDVNLTTPLPTTTPNVSVTGTFTATDIVVAAPVGDGTLVSGASTAGSIVALALPSNMSAWIIMLKVYTTGTVYSEASPNSTNGTDGDWVEIKGRKTGTAPGIESVGYAFTSAGIYRGNAASFTWFRLRYLGTFTAGMTALISLSHATGAVFLNSGIPAGNSVLGKVGLDQAATSAVTVMQNAVAVTGNGTSLVVTGYGTAVLQVGGTFVGSIAFETFNDLTATWVAISATQIGAGDIFTVATVPGVYRMTVAGLDLIRARVTWTSGTSITINGRATNAINASKIMKLATSGLTVGKVYLTDGTNTVGVTSSNLAGNETLLDRAKVNASLRLFDTAQATGAQLVAAKGDQTTGLWVAVKSSVLPTGAAQDGTDITTPFAMPTGGVGIRGWLSAIWTKLNGVLDISDRAARLLGVLSTGSNIIGKVGVDQTTDGTTNAVRLLAETTKVIGTVNIAASQTIAATQATAANLNMTATPIAITKGTQGAAGFTTQDLKDAGRNPVHYYMVIPVLTSATDTLQSMTGTKAGATVVATTTPAVVTTGKTFRVTRLAATYIATAVSGYGIVRLRFNTAGVVTITSPIAATLLVGAGAPTTANSTASEEAALDEGWEFAAATGVGISVQGFAAVTATAVGYVLVSLTGYEY